MTSIDVVSCTPPRIRNTTRQRNRPAFTRIELLVVVSITTLLISLVLPNLGGTKKNAHRVRGASDMRQTLIAITVLADGDRGILPSGKRNLVGGKLASVVAERATHEGYLRSDDHSLSVDPLPPLAGRLSVNPRLALAGPTCNNSSIDEVTKWAREMRYIMKRLEVFDPAMCCSTGLCGTDVDPRLVQFAADLDWLRDQGVQVQRFNLSQEPLEFVKHEGVKEIVMRTHGKGLPAVVADGDLVSEGRYPNRSELATIVGLDAKVSPPGRADVSLTVASSVKAKADESCCGPTGCC